jgi:nicotinamidase-related amidase
MVVLERLRARDAGLLVIDVQEKLLARMPESEALVVAIRKLVRGAQALEIPVWGTEQYPKGLGPTVPAVAELVGDLPAKMTFSCCGCSELVEQLHGRGPKHVTLCGIEAHVCVAQTALELLQMGFIVQVAADAVASRKPFDRDIALRRMERAGVVVSTVEAIVFEWVGSAEAAGFKAISALVKEKG